MFRQQFESLKRNNEKEVAFLKSKFSELATKATQSTVNESFNNSIRRMVEESPVNFHRTPARIRSSQDVIDLNDCITPPCSEYAESPSVVGFDILLTAKILYVAC